MADEITIVIKGDDGQILKTFNKVEKEAKSSGSKSSKQFGSTFTSGVSKSLATLGPAILAVGAGLVAAFGGKKVIEAASRQQDAVNQLNQALRNAGSFSQAASKDLQNFASELQQVTTIGDETTLEMLSLAKAFGTTNDQAKELVEAAVNLSAATGISLESAVKNLGKTLGGLTGELGETVPALRNLSAEALKSGAGIEFVAKRFAGAGAASAATFAGRMQQLTNNFGDLLEEIGNFIIKSPAITGILDGINKAIKAFTDKIKNFNKDEELLKLSKDIIEFGLVTNRFLVYPLELTLNTLKALITVGAGLAALVEAGFSSESGVENLIKQLQIMNDTAVDLKKSFEFNPSETIESFLNNLRETLNGITPGLKDFGNTVEKELLSPWDKFEDFFAEFGAGFKSGLDKMTQNTRAFGATVAQTMMGGVVNSFAALGGALARGESASEAFGKTMLGVLGDLAIQLGTFIFLQALAGQFLGFIIPTWFAAVGAIPMGLALIALGGALKAIAGGIGGPSPSTSAPSGGIVTGGTPIQTGTGPLPTDEGGVVTDFTGDNQRLPVTQVAVNIQGDVLDSDQTGLRIAQIINEQFDTNGVVLAT